MPHLVPRLCVVGASQATQNHLFCWSISPQFSSSSTSIYPSLLLLNTLFILIFYSDCFISRPLGWCVCLNSAALVIVHPEVKNWIKYARFEEKHGYIAHGRKVYERAVEFFGEEHVDENLFVAFARFEETQKEVNAAQTSQISFWHSFCWRSYCVMYLFTFVLYLYSSSEFG